MKPYTDADITITIEGADLSTGSDIHFTLAQNGREIDTDDITATPDGEGGCSLAVSLTQVQTSRMKDNADATAQVNWLDGNGKRKATEPVTIPVGAQLLRRVIYGD